MSEPAFKPEAARDGCVVGHGVDLVEVDRIERMLSDHGESFVDRCFTAVERDWADRGGGRRAERLAARFACKEAVLKAIGTGWAGGTTWQDVEVRRDPNGRPYLNVQGRSAELAADLGITNWHVSLSHTAGHAMASVIGCGPGPGHRDPRHPPRVPEQAS
ncbi:MAG: holo-ACP synthase [Planctomycetota bacterium]|jgi:holo-[acyl-carrier protein] synthase